MKQFHIFGSCQRNSNSRARFCVKVILDISVYVYKRTAPHVRVCVCLQLVSAISRGWRALSRLIFIIFVAVDFLRQLVADFDLGGWLWRLIFVIFIYCWVRSAWQTDRRTHAQRFMFFPPQQSGERVSTSILYMKLRARMYLCVGPRLIVAADFLGRFSLFAAALCGCFSRLFLPSILMSKTLSFMFGFWSPPKYTDFYLLLAQFWMKMLLMSDFESSYMNSPYKVYFDWKLFLHADCSFKHFYSIIMEYRDIDTPCTSVSGISHNLMSDIAYTTVR